MRSHVARAFAVVCLIFMSACAGPKTPSITPNLQNEISPQVWQQGTPPAHWQFFTPPHYPPDGDVYQWPIVDPKGNIAYGFTGGYPAGAPNQGAIQSINYSGSLVGTVALFGDQVDPAKPFLCANGKQVCARGGHYALGPDNVIYDGNNNPGVIDGVGTSDTTIWFTTCCIGSYIVRANEGQMHFYRIPDSADLLHDIALAPDGRVWVTLQDHITKFVHLARLDPSTSAVTVFPFQMQDNPRQLVVGPDGNLWFTLNSTLYRVNSTSAALTRFPMHQTANGYLAFASDRSIWAGYDTSVDQGFVHLSPAGSILETISCPTNICANDASKNRIVGLTVGPDGDVWFAYSTLFLFNPNPPPNVSEGIGVYILHSISVSPASVTFNGAGQTSTITFSESNYSGSFTTGSTNTNVVRVVKTLSPTSVQIQSVAPGTARIIVRDTMNNYYGVTVTVSS